MANENLIFDDSMLAETLPTGIINLGDDNHIANMANFSMYFNAKEAVNPVKEETKLSQDELAKFGNWTGQADTKVMAKDLMKRGLVGAGQLVNDTVNVNSPDAIRNAQSDWKQAAIQQILSNARKLNLRKPEEVMANKDVLIGNQKWRDAINTQDFQTIHPNFWQIISHSLLPEQWAKVDSVKDLVKK